MKTAIDFQRQAAFLGITFWATRTCSFCQSPIGYQIEQGKLYWNGNCDCTTLRFGLEERSWELLSDYYNRQTNPAMIACMDAFWGFNNKGSDETN